MVQQTKIRIAPTNTYVDCYIFDNFNELPEIHEMLSYKYKMPLSHYEESVTGSMTGIISFGRNASILMVAIRNPAVIAHELVHVTWKLGQIIGYTHDLNNQEFQAYTVSYLMEKLDKLWNR